MNRPQTRAVIIDEAGDIIEYGSVPTEDHVIARGKYVVVDLAQFKDLQAGDTLELQILT